MQGSRVSFSLAPSRRRSSLSLPSLRQLASSSAPELALEEAGEDAAAGLRELADAVPTQSRSRSCGAAARRRRWCGRRRSAVDAARRCAARRRQGRSNAEIAQSMQALIQSKAELANIQQRVDSMLKTYEQGEVDEAIAAVTERATSCPRSFPWWRTRCRRASGGEQHPHLLGTLSRRAAEPVDERRRTSKLHAQVLGLATQQMRALERFASVITGAGCCILEGREVALSCRCACRRDARVASTPVASSLSS